MENATARKTSLFSRISIKYQIMSIALIAMIGFASYFIFVNSSNNKTAQHLHDIKLKYFPALTRFDHNIYQLERLKEGFTSAFTLGESELVEKNRLHFEKMVATYQEIQALDTSLSADIKQILVQLTNYHTIAAKLTLGMINKSLKSSEIKTLIPTMNKNLKVLRSHLKDVRGIVYDHYLSALKGADRSFQQALMLGLIIGVIVLLVTGGIAFHISSSTSRSLKNVSSSLNKLASGEGDLTLRIESNRGDEIGDLVHSFNLYLDNMHDMISKVFSIATSLTSSAEELSAISKSASDDIDQQNTNINSMAAAMNQMLHSATEVSKNSEINANEANEANKQSVTGQEIVANTMKSITLLSGEINTASEVIKRLEQESDNVGTVLDVIRGIAEQTNLLALNAAIEAARAGEQGRGFAVVADEVRTLASRTQESTTEIQEMLTRLQSGSNEAVSVMERSRDRAQDGVDLSQKASSSLTDIVKTVENINQINTFLAQAGKEQTEVARELNQNVSSISEFSENNSTTINQVHSTSTELSNISTDLYQLVQQFKL